MDERKHDEKTGPILGPDGRRHFRLNAEPGSMGMRGSPLGKEAKPRFMVPLKYPDGQVRNVSTISAQEAAQAFLDPVGKVFEKDRLLATALVAESKQVHAVSSPSGRGEIDALRAKVSELENRPRRRLWFVVDAEGSWPCEATSREKAVEAFCAEQEISAAEAAETIVGVYEVTVEDLATLLDGFSPAPTADQVPSFKPKGVA